MKYAVGLLVRSDLRRRWVGVVALSLVIGAAGAFVLTAATGARRADSALARFSERTLMWDVAMQVDYDATQAVLSAAAADPAIASVGAFVEIPMFTDEDFGGVLAGLGGGWLDTMYRPRLIAGRLPVGDQVAEVLISESLAEQSGLNVGSSVVLSSFLGDEYTQTVTVVGIHRGVIDRVLIEAPQILATSAFGEYWGDRMYSVVAGTPEGESVRPRVAARLHGGPSQAPTVFAAIAGRHPDARPSVQYTADLVSAFDAGLSIQVEAFWLLTIVAGIASALLVGSGIAYFVRATAHTDAAMRALGITGRERALVRFVPAAIFVTAGSLLAVMGAVFASPLVPLGSARRVDPDTGIWVDPATFAVGAAAIFVGLGLIAGLAAVRHAAPRNRRPRTAQGGRMPVWGRLGRDLAFRGNGRGQASLLASAVGLGLVITVVVYSASLDHLLVTPRLSGQNFEVWVFEGDDAGDGSPVFGIDLEDPAIEAAAGMSKVQVALAGQVIEAVIIDPLRGSAGGTVLSGRSPVGADEVGLGPGLLALTGLEVGDAVAVGSAIQGAGETTLQIVGEVLVPSDGDGDYGEGVWLSVAAGELLNAEELQSVLILQLADGVVPDDLPALSEVDWSEVTLPSEARNIGSAGGIPRALGAFGAVLGATMVGFGLAGIVRERRRDLAIVGALGMDRRGIRATVGAAGLFIVVPGLVVGLLGGVVLGRVAWARVAGDVPTVVQPIVPVGTIVAVVLTALAVAAFVTAWPAWRAGTVDPSRTLHRE